MNEITNLPATQIAQEIKAGRFSAREVVDAHIEAVNLQISAVVAAGRVHAGEESDRQPSSDSVEQVALRLLLRLSAL